VIDKNIFFYMVTNMGSNCCGMQSHVPVFGDSDMLERYAERGLHSGIAAKCVSVYDGDTATFRVILMHHFVNVKVRFRGIDAPEIRTRNRDEKRAATQARDYLSAKILHEECELIDLGNDKFNSRTVATVLWKGTDICKEMLQVQGVCEYTGKSAKPSFASRV